MSFTIVRMSVYFNTMHPKSVCTCIYNFTGMTSHVLLSRYFSSYVVTSCLSAILIGCSDSIESPVLVYMISFQSDIQLDM